MNKKKVVCESVLYIICAKQCLLKLFLVFCVFLSISYIVLLNIIIQGFLYKWKGLGGNIIKTVLVIT